MTEKKSRVHEFYKKTREQRLEIIKEFSSLSQEEIGLLENSDLDFDAANRMIENVISVMNIPLAVAPNFLINSKEYFVPMAIEESSVVAAASYAAKLSRESGGFKVSASTPIMIGQVHIKSIPDVDVAVHEIEKNKKKLLEMANSVDPVLLSVGGGARDIQCRRIAKNMLMVHLLVDVRDAMGANIVNTMSEKITSKLALFSRGKVGVRIVSNLSVYRMVSAKCVWKKDSLGQGVIDGILDAYELACLDPFRCVTHNKGIMNGIDAIAIATGNDFRAIEAGAHGYAACSDGGYKSLTHYYTNEHEDLVGELKVPIAVGIVGGITQSHPMAKLCIKILGVKSASELSCVMGAVGLAQNFAALKALVSEGISRGHMRLHSKNIALNAGVPKEIVDEIAQQMIDEDNISVGRARELLKTHGF